MHGTITGKVVAASAEHRLQKARDEFWFFRTLIHPKMRRQRNSSNVSQTRNWTRKSPLTGSLLRANLQACAVKAVRRRCSAASAAADYRGNRQFREIDRATRISGRAALDG